MNLQREFDVVVIGAGPAGEVLAGRLSEGAAQAVSGSLDGGAVLARRDEIVSCLDDAKQVPWLQDAGAVLVRGHARLESLR